MVVVVDGSVASGLQSHVSSGQLPIAQCVVHQASIPSCPAQLLIARHCFCCLDPLLNSRDLEI